ncbi:hypothetical protein LV457_13285 [Mycobacterium sp. MYCO198283]|uniref:hypothetical protein n=1 Tax=Mycobacterium sp. MYCO198283 TaxID=2883505 RepID=UPI001E300F6D|nr:hypothetical protein [Mycobacterium sp. MYCO198283]MCG5433252.1 hypothetical protein [Mycobacterium sp. MYCO198283]
MASTTRARRTAYALLGCGAVAGAIWAAPAALADPPPPPAPVDAPPVATPPAPNPPVATPPADPSAPAPADPNAPPLAAAPPPAGVPHLPSPDNPPPGTTLTPTGHESRGLSYLRELWQAVQTQDISAADAALLLTQRPLDPNATPPPGMAAGPQGPPAPPPTP